VTLVNGAFSISLPASDDTLNSPATWFYLVTVRTLEWNASFYLPVLIALAGSGAKLSQLLDHVAIPSAPGFDLAGFLQKTGGTMTGALILNADPVANLGAATRQFVLAQAASGVADATTTTKGKVQLAGDLAGTAAAPTVPALSGKAATVHTHAESDVTNLTSDLSTLTSSVAGKANTSHTHVEADTTNLVTDLAAKVAKSTVTAKGDLLVATASATITNLGVGSNTQVLTADSAQATGMKWAPAAGGGSSPAVYLPAGYGLTAISADPLANQNPQPAGSNIIWYMRLPTPVSGTVTNLWVACGVGGTWDASTTPNQIGIYDDTGATLGATANDSTLWTSVGWRGGAVVGGAVAVATSYFYVLAIIRGMSNEQLCYPSSPNDTHTFASRGPGQTKRRCGYVTASALPGSFDPTAYGTESGYAILCGVS